MPPAPINDRADDADDADATSDAGQHSTAFLAPRGHLPMTTLDEAAMLVALDQAHNARLVGEVPVGAVIYRSTVEGRQIVATGYNRPITDHDPTAHAEIVALRHAAQLLGNYRLPECEIYVTLEPCAMCAMALLHARVKRVVYGARDPKAGAAGSVIDLFANRSFNHHTELVGDVMAEVCGETLRSFFVERREHYRNRHATPIPIPAGESHELDADDADGQP